MQCATIKQGIECAFMTRKGCNFNGGRCHVIVEACDGCAKTLTNDEGTFCTVAPNPEAKWARGKCNFATHIKNAEEIPEEKKLNPLKASKRAAAGRR